MVASAGLPRDCDARVRRVFEYWRAIRPAEDRLPGRQHLDPGDLAEVLRWLWLVDVQREPLRFRYRLIGTGHREVLGVDLTGKWIDDAFAHFPRMPGYADFVAALGGEVRHRRGAPEIPVGEKYVARERLLLPLARDGATVDMLLGVSVYTRADGTVA